MRRVTKRKFVRYTAHTKLGDIAKWLWSDEKERGNWFLLFFILSFAFLTFFLQFSFFFLNSLKYLKLYLKNFLTVSNFYVSIPSCVEHYPFWTIYVPCASEDFSNIPNKNWIYLLYYNIIWLYNLCNYIIYIIYLYNYIIYNTIQYIIIFSHINF